MRWDLDGDGAVTGGNATSYEAAFPGAAAGMGCPDGSDADDTPDACTGYELTRDLDFDTDGSGVTWAGPVNSPVADPNDAYYNGGGGFVPIGNQSARFNTTFHGNGHVIANLFSQRSHHDVGFFGATGTSARIVAVGFRNLRVRGWNRVGGLVGQNQGRVAAVWVTGNALGGNTARALASGHGAAARMALNIGTVEPGRPISAATVAGPSLLDLEALHPSLPIVIAHDLHGGRLLEPEG